MCIYCYMFTLQSPAKHCIHLMQHTDRGIFPTAQVFELADFDAILCSFLFCLFQIGKSFPSGGVFPPGETSKLFRARSGEKGG